MSRSDSSYALAEVMMSNTSSRVDEVLVAADIVRTVAISPTFTSVGVPFRQGPDPNVPPLDSRIGNHRAVALGADENA